MKNQVLERKSPLNTTSLLVKMRGACKKIAPLWPLESFVAVNPYMGFADQKFEKIAQYFNSVAGIQLTLPKSFYLNKLEEGKIVKEDIQKVVSKYSDHLTAEEFITKLYKTDEWVEAKPSVLTLTDVASEYLKNDWNHFVTSRISAWAASYFDSGQATWAAAYHKTGIYKSWKMEAEVDRTTAISGLKDFRKIIKDFPEDYFQAAQKALESLNIPENTLDTYLHRLLLKNGGWAAYIARLDWDKNLKKEKGGALLEFLTILLCFEAGILKSLSDSDVPRKWDKSKKKFFKPDFQTSSSAQLSERILLQEAFDQSAQRELISKFQKREPEQRNPKKSKVQAVFCIDVRSEVYRRNLERVDSDFETLGFAGFFGFPVNYFPIGHEKGEAQCPVLLQPTATVHEEIKSMESNDEAYENRLFQNQVQQVWKSFKSGAVTCFSYVSPLGLSYLPKLFTDSFGISRPVPHPDKIGLKKKHLKNRNISTAAGKHHHNGSGFSLNQKVQMAKGALTAMSLTDNFADYVLIVGHGSTTVNNPHASGLDCGACGGRSGEANARVAASVFNEMEVRQRLKKENIYIPEQTVFLPALHDTTTDEVKILCEDGVSTERINELSALRTSLEKAGKLSRAERAKKLSISENIDKSIKGRSKDWSQVRPEWGLAGCSAFIVAPRERTKNVNLEGRSFLHSYDWKKDKDFAVLEQIMTAPLVVTSWINLQYYASTTDNRHFGAGNKTLHNLTAGVGVVEGFSGDLRLGLPMQSVHDGSKFQHEPVRLKVIIEAPVEEMNRVLEKHKSVRDLFDNEWMHLFAMNDQGQVSLKYTGNYRWDQIKQK